MTVNKDDVKKALEALQAVGSETISKGHAPGDRVNTEVDSMVSETTDHQVHHTSSNSDVGTWAGTAQTVCPENGTVDGIDGNGTDYKAAAAMAKACAVKLGKGESLNPVESAFVEAGGLSKAYDFGKKDDDKDDDKDMNKGKDDDKDEDKDMNKSFADLASESEEMKKGFEVSDYLSANVEVMNKALDCMESRIVDRVAGFISAQTASTEEFQVTLAKAMVRMAESQAATGQRIDQVEATPARGPLSTQAVQAIEKSFGTAGAPDVAPLERNVIQGALESLMVKGQVPGIDVIKHETSGEITPQNMQLVKSFVNGTGQ